MQSVECYAAALCIILGIFIVAHFTRVIAYRTGLSKKSIAKPFVVISRYVSETYFFCPGPWADMAQSRPEHLRSQGSGPALLGARQLGLGLLGH